MQTDRYISPLSARYASAKMQALFSSDEKFSTWRRLWVALAEIEKDLGLPITDDQIAELKEHIDDINYDVAVERERKVRHDVMAHVYAYGVQCPNAKGIIHLGATSCYVGDNTDLIIMKKALELLGDKLLKVIDQLADFSERYKDLPTLGYTHFQPAQTTTVGKRASLWLQDLVADYEYLTDVHDHMLLLGSKGTTGTQASFLELFEGDYEKVDALDPALAAKFGFPGCVAVSGQTYSRKNDLKVLSVLSQIAVSASKFAGDIRLLQHMKEIEEPFGKDQIGSSAMAYKRNPMRCERISSITRYVMINTLNPALTAATQWFERTLDDSANRRISIAEGFLAIDGVLDLMINVTAGLVVYPKTIEAHLMAELPFMASENLLMDAVKAGGDRQELHEIIREASMEAAKRVKEEGADNDLLERLASNPGFNLDRDSIEAALDPARYTGCAAHQVEKYLSGTVRPLLESNAGRYENAGSSIEV